MAKVVIGLDLSEREWRCVAVSRAGKDKIRIEGYSRLPAPPFALKDFIAADQEDSDLVPLLTNYAAEVSPTLGPIIASSSTVVVGLPQESVSLRVLNIPFTQESKISRVLPFEVESSLLEDAEEMLFDFTPITRLENCTQVLSAALDRERLRGFLDHLRLLAIDPVALTPTSLCFHQLARLFPDQLGNGNGRTVFLQLGGLRSQMSAVEAGRTIFAMPLPALNPDENQNGDGSIPPRFLGAIERAFHFLEGFSVNGDPCPPPVRQVLLIGELSPAAAWEQQLAERLGAPVRAFRLPADAFDPDTQVAAELQPDLAPALALALLPLSAGKNVNFRREQYAYKPESRELLQRLIFPAILCLLLVAALGFRMASRGSSGANQSKAIVAEMQNALKAAVPQAPAADPVIYLKQLFEQAKAKSQNYQDLSTPTALEVLAAISTTIPTTINVTVSALDYKGDRASISGTAEKLEDPNEITKLLAQVPYFEKVELENSALTGNDQLYRFRINITLKKGGGP